MLGTSAEPQHNLVGNLVGYKCPGYITIIPVYNQPSSVQGG